jgi:hypothetical protein
MTMNSTSFEFSMQVSGGRALLGAVRDLASHVASYAGGKAVAAAVADEVMTAAEAAFVASHVDGTSIDVRFRRTAEYLDVFVAGGQATTRSTTHQTRGPGLSVNWSVEDGRQVCHIRQGMA